MRIALGLSVAAGTLVSAGPAVAGTTDDHAPATASCAAPSGGHAGCGAIARSLSTPGRTSRQVTASWSKGHLWPADVQAFYGLPPALSSLPAGSGETVAVVLASLSPTLVADYAYFRAYNKMAPCTTGSGCLSFYDQSGRRLTDLSSAPRHPDWYTEAALDMQAVATTCPSCRLVVVFAKDAQDASLQAAAMVAAAHAPYVSMSYGSHEQSTLPSALARGWLDDYIDPGHMFFAGTGDDGSPSTLWPASATGVIGVAGLSVARRSGAFFATAWAGSGAGCSLIPAVTDLRSLISSIASVCPLGRATTVVSGPADPESGLVVRSAGAWFSVGGTSLATPLTAGLAALSRAVAHGGSVALGVAARTSVPVTQANAGLRADWLDPTVGTSASGLPTGRLDTAMSGWDGPTGIGYPGTPWAFLVGDGGGVGPPVATAVNRPSAPVALARGVSGVALRVRGLPPGTRLIGADLVIPAGTPKGSGVGSVSIAGVVHGQYAARTMTVPWRVVSVAGSSIRPPVKPVRSSPRITVTGRARSHRRRLVITLTVMPSTRTVTLERLRVRNTPYAQLLWWAGVRRVTLPASRRATISLPRATGRYRVTVARTATTLPAASRTVRLR